MNYFHVWCNLKPGVDDQRLTASLRSYLDELRRRGWIHSFTVTRRKLGFSPPELGEFHVSMQVERLDMLDRAFDRLARHDEAIEPLHASVYSSVKDLRTALYRDFPGGGSEFEPVVKGAGGAGEP